MILCLLLAVLSADVFAQSAGSVVKIVGVKLVAGKRQVVVRGVASDLVTYVYKLNVRKGQTVAIKINSSEPELTFSVFLGKDERLGFRVKEWSDTAFSSGTYSIVLAINRERAASARRFQYEADVRKRFNDEELRRLKVRLRNAEVLGRGGTETEKLLNAEDDERAAMEFRQGIELLKLDQQIAELKARQKEGTEKIPYNLSVKLK